jgi:monothiol glutaredoxin
MALSAELRTRIEQTLAQHKIVLFMKGTRFQPRCGFSAQVISILDGHGVQYHDIDVLSDPALRDGIKEFGSWPTIPQLYFQGSLVGGSDIIRQLDESGELLPTLGQEAAVVDAPAIKLDASAAAAIKDAGKEAEAGQLLRMELKNGGRAIDMYFDEPKPSDLRVEQHGITILFDRASARLASGISIEFVDGANGGFKIDNPNLPAKVKVLNPRELKDKLDQKVPLHLYDVRGDQERAVASIAGAKPFDDKARAELSALPKDAFIVFHCHHGMRSQAAAEQIVGQGFRNVHNLRGGIEAWSTEVDPKVPRY